jgi:hypothetical protein
VVPAAEASQTPPRFSKAVSTARAAVSFAAEDEAETLLAFAFMLDLLTEHRKRANPHS